MEVAVQKVTTKQDGKWWGQYEDHLSKVSQLTRKAYLEDLNSFSRFFQEENEGKNFSPELINRHDLKAWQVAGRIRLSPATLNRRRASIKAFCRWAMKHFDLTYDPCTELELIPEEPRGPRWLEKKEFGSLVRYVETMVNQARTDHWKWQAKRDQAMVDLMLFGGLREMEVARLDVDDVSLGERSGKVIIRQGKGGKRREVPLSAEVRRALSGWMEARGKTPGPLFIGKRGERVSTRAIQKRICEIGRICKIEGLTPHRLRHTFAKRSLDGGTQITVVSKILGHSRIDTTAIYTQPGWSDLERAVEAV